jgi:L-asparaginase
MPVKALPTVGVMVTGGTIDALGVDPLDLAAYQEAGRSLSPDELLARVPEAERFAQVRLVDGPRVQGPNAGLEATIGMMRQLTATLGDDDLDGLVVTRGTNTLEEFAWLAHLTLATTKPLVFVGAMRPASGMSSDGDLNLVRGIQVAADPAARGQGVLVLLNDTIYSARDVTKGATYRVDAFSGRDLGPLGYADADGRVTLYHAHRRRHTQQSAFAVGSLGPVPRVDVVVSYLGADGVLIDAALAAGARGIVAAGMGAGFPTSAEMEALRRARDAGLVVCIATRVGSGRVVRRPILERERFVAADNLVPWKARLLLAVCLARGMPVDEIQAAFENY